jgi:error-prone DNA polymerase
MTYVELHSRSAFSFLRGASLPEQLAEVAAQSDLPAMAVCDRDGVYGAPRFFSKAREHGIRPIIGAELTMDDGSILPVLVESRMGYQNLCQLLTRAHLRSAKGECAVRWDELPEFASGLVALTGDENGPLIRSLATERPNVPSQKMASSRRAQKLRIAVEINDPMDVKVRTISNGGEQSHENFSPREVLEKLQRAFGEKNVFVEIQRHHVRGEDRVNRQLIELAQQFHLPLLATNGVLYAKDYGREVLDVFTCLRHHTHLDLAGKLLSQNSERHLKTDCQMRELFCDLPEAIENTSRLAERLQFSLENLGYEFPSYEIPPGHTMDSFLREKTFAGARNRYAGIIPEKVRAQIENELALISKLKVAGYFLIVWDLVKFCREQNIMAQGRGSAANSTVCFCLGITAVDPLKFNTLFERFLTEGRKNSWPDIDIDLPSGERRERVIQEVYQRYGKRGAAMTANVITYRGRSAAREIGKALNFSPDVLNRFSHLFANGDFPETLDLQTQLAQAGIPPSHPRSAPFVNLYRAMHGLARHLGQHSGGMIVCRGKLDSVVPLENASMPGRVVAQWDKDDCEDLGIVKVDLLGLGMMSVLQDSVELCRKTGREIDLAQLPEDDTKTFAMAKSADTIGVFQIESRAQMATLPRMKPKTFYDLVVEVAIIRPGPIQGHLMHPYLERRKQVELGADPKHFPCYHENLRPVLERTYGIPLFQEQMLQMAMVMADFTGAEAEELRRALSFHRSDEKMRRVEKKLRAAMERKGHSQKVIDEVAKTVGSFALYGFPESHAISFAHLAYASAYLKAHRAPEFYASLLNNQPMGFYSSDTLIKDARRHGVRIRPVCMARSDWECTIEAEDSLRLGLCVVGGLRKERALETFLARQRASFVSMEDFKMRCAFNKDELRTLAAIGALNCFAEHRRDALWDVEKIERPGELFSQFDSDTRSPLAPMTPIERLHTDYSAMRLSTGAHPMALMRAQLKDIWRAADLAKAPSGKIVRIAGHVICRQRPSTANGFVFISLEDETGVSNAIVSPRLFEELRLVITQENFLIIEGLLQKSEGVIHVRAQKIEALRHEQLMGSPSHDFH